MAQARTELVLSEVTAARGVRGGNPVEPGAVFTPDLNPVYVWFRISGATRATTLRSVWHYLGAGNDNVIAEGEFTVPARARWADVRFTLPPGKRLPLGEYRVDIVAGDKEAGRIVATTSFRVADASARPTVVEARPARGVRDGKPVEPGEIFAPSAKEILVWFRVSGINAPTRLRSVWNYIAADGEQFITETETTLVPGHDWGDVRVELPPGRPWPTGEYRVDLLIGDSKAVSVPFRVVDSVARPSVVTVRVARGVRDGLPVDPGEVFAPDTGKIYVWFRMAGHNAPTKLRGVWHYLGGGSDRTVAESELTIQAYESWGDFNLELPPGRPWPKGEYRFEIMIGGALAASVSYRIAEAQTAPVAQPPVAADATPRAAATPQQLDWCSGKAGATPDLQIGGCTAAIDSGRFGGTSLAVFFNNRGLTYANKGQFDRAIEDCDQAIRLDPKNGAAFNNRGFAYTRKGQLDRAVQDYEQAIVINPQDAQAFNNRGFVAYASKGQYDRAIEDYDQAIRLNPQYAQAFHNRGLAYASKGQHDRAIVDYHQAVQLNPQNAAYFNSRGAAYANKGQFDRAIADYDQAIRLSPRFAASFFNRGLAYANKIQHDRAIEDYDQAIQLNPQIAAYYNSRGVAYQIKKDYDRAIADYDQALRLNPQNAVSFYNRGLVYENKGQHDRAIADYDQALLLNPNYTPAINNRATAVSKKNQ